MLSLHRGLLQCLMALLLACCAVLPAQAQQRLSASEAVELALSQPHVRGDIEAGIDLARSDVLAARTWSNPTLEASRERLDEGPLGPSTETSLVLSQTFELGGRRSLKRRAAERGVVAAEATARYQRQQVKGEVLRAYFTAAASERQAQMLSSQLSGLQELARIADRRHQAGDLSGYESRRIAQARTQAEARHANALSQAKLARAELSGWTGEVGATAELTDALPPIPETVTDQQTGLELQALKARSEQAEQAQQAANRLSFPVSVGLGRKRITEGGFSDDALVMEVGVPLPLFDRNQAERLRTSAEARRVDAQYRRALLQSQGRRAAAHDNALQLSESAQHLNQTVVPEAERLTEIARNSFAEGELDLVGLLDAYDAQASAVEQATEQQVLALEAILELERLTSTTPTNP